MAASADLAHHGHFAFRTTHSHQEIRDFKVYQLK